MMDQNIVSKKQKCLKYYDVLNNIIYYKYYFWMVNSLLMPNLYAKTSSVFCMTTIIKHCFQMVFWIQIIYIWLLIKHMLRKYENVFFLYINKLLLYLYVTLEFLLFNVYT